MTTCPSCKYYFARVALRCPNCGITFDETSPTKYLPTEKDQQAVYGGGDKQRSIHASSDGAKFAAGTMLAGRYRIVSLLGRGGMGEVYKAEDLKLKQVVALKFLPQVVAHDGAALARFQNEVRITRQVSHPNVCRVYDIGETEGLHFLSMEYIDGEDLSHLLRRIGRLQSDKANAIARQICAGLAAAHDNNVLHRDLKPANIMIDGRGKARVTDFGVAVVAKELLGREATAGTPAYMAPEQLTGKEVTQRSDIYSLGLVLYELFTGKPVYDADNVTDLISLHERSTPANPSDHINDIDPLVERVIMRCLEKDPDKRPATAIQVAAALPGGDPLAAALAAGETPSPEMVAASGEKTGLRPAVAVGLLVSIVVGLVIAVFVGNKVIWQAKLISENSPDMLAHKAEDIIQRLGYTEKPVGRASGFFISSAFTQYFGQNNQSGDRWSQYINARPCPIIFWYRRSPRYLEPTTFDNFGWVWESDPPKIDVSGMASVRLDPAGRLLYFLAVPPQVDEPAEKPPSPDWAPLFAAAGLDPAAFTSIESTWTPEPAFDTRAAWTGSFPNQPDIAFRVEAAAYRGKPVYFNVIGPWTFPWKMQEFQQSTGQNIGFAIFLILTIGLIMGAVLLARKNLRQGRGDRRGAARLSFFVFSVTVLAWLFGADHSPTFGEVFRFFIMAVSQGLLVAGVVWLFYIALEPYVRRRWPETIITWSRVLGGSLRDPLVGRDVLIGVLFGVIITILDQLSGFLRLSTGTVPSNFVSLDALPGARQLVAVGLLSNINSSIFGSLLIFFLIFLLRVLTRRRWIAAFLFVLIFSVPNVLQQSNPMVAAPLFVLTTGLAAIVCLRLGLLTLAASSVVSFLQNIPITTDFSAWYASNTIIAFAAVLALAVWAFHTSLGRQKLFAGGLLDE